MRKSQPIDESNEKLMKFLGIKEETEEEKASGRRVASVQTVDEMFDFHYAPTFWSKVLRPFRRLKLRLKARKRSTQNFREWRKLFEEYYPWSIDAFLPMFIKHLELYIKHEKKQGIAAPECKAYKIATAQEAMDILERLVADDYDSVYTAIVEEKWGKFPYEKTTFANGSVSFQHLTPDGYDDDKRAAYENGAADAGRDLKRLGELIEQNMLDWWD